MSISTCWSEGLGPKVFYSDVKYPVRALCGTEPATGLYLAFRVLPADGGGTKTAKAVKVAYEEPQESEEERAQREEAEKAARRFTLAFVDADGFLQPVMDTNPWHEIHAALQLKAAEWEERVKKWGAKKQNRGVPPPPLPPVNRNPDSVKLLPGTKIEACMVRHPSAHLALALCGWLNGQGDPHEYGFEQWGAPESLLRTLSTDKDSANNALSISVSSAPEDYYPRGPKRYGGWTLYVDMPHASVPSVVEAVKRLQDDLGRLRYPVGGNSPYGGYRLVSENNVEVRKDSPNYGVFDLLAASAVYSFQLHASYGYAFQLADKALAYANALKPSASSRREEPKNSWAYLIGWTIKRPPLLDHEKVDWGVVDPSTSAAIRKWLEEGLRKPGQVLVELPATDSHTENHQWVDWARPELACAFELWRELVKALGGTYGISFSHIFRDAGAAGGVGRAECSIHKTGNAVDLAVKGSLVSGNENVVDFSLPAYYFPIRFEANWNWDSRSQLGKLKRALERAEKDLEKARSTAKAKLKTRLSNTGRDVQDAKAKIGEAGKGKVKVPRFKDDALSARLTLWLDAAGLGSHLAASQSRLAHLQRLSSDLEKGDVSEIALPDEPTLPEVAKVRAAQGRLKVAREQYDRARQDDVPVRSAFRINWRLYEHSTFNAFAYHGNPDKLTEEVAQLLGAPPMESRSQAGLQWEIERNYRRLLRNYVPRPDRLLLASVTGAAFLGPQEDSAPPAPPGTLQEDDILLPGVEAVPSSEEMERLTSASWNELVDAMIEARPEVKRCREVAQKLVNMGGQQLLSSFFRYKIQQFIYNPFEADGGHDGPEITPAADADGVLEYMDKTEEVRRLGVTKGAKSFLNITALAYHCGLLRIGGNRGGWRDPRTDPGRKVKAPYQKLKVDGHLGPLAGLIDRMDAAETGEDDDLFFVISKEGRIAHWVKSVDKSFLLRWARELKKGAEAKARQRKSKGPAGFFPEQSSRTISSRMVLNLSVREDEQQQIRDLLKAFPNKRFRITHVGHTVKHVQAADSVSGQDLLTQYEAALKDFLEELRARVEREQEAAKAAKAAREAKGKSQGKGSPPNPAAAVNKKPMPSQPRKPDDWTIIVQPYFDLDPPPPGSNAVLTQELLKVNDASTGPLTLGPGDVIEVPTPGVGRALEWWHYETEHANRASWGQLLEEIGYAEPVFAASAMPSRLILPRRYLSRGYDFDPAEQLGGIKGGGVIGIPPENLKPKVAPADLQETAGVPSTAVHAGG